MWARVSRFKEPAERIDEDVRETKRLVTEWVEKVPGSKGLYYLVDRENGQTMAVTLWESEEAMRASDEEADRVREESASKIGGEIVSVDRYEVAIQPSEVMAGAR